jgi:hypothetical protein
MLQIRGGNAMTKVVWRETPKDHDYPAAATSLALLTSADTIEAVITGLRSVPLTRQKAKDMLRTSRLPLLAHVNVRVAADLKMIQQRRPLCWSATTSSPASRPTRQLTVIAASVPGSPSARICPDMGGSVVRSCANIRSAASHSLVRTADGCVGGRAAGVPGAARVRSDVALVDEAPSGRPGAGEPGGDGVVGFGVVLVVGLGTR